MPSADTGVMADTAVMPPPRAAPMPPALPVMGPCPDGWRAVGIPDGPELCEPFPETGLASCADHEAHFPGTPGCQRIGTECAADGWPSDLPSTGVVFARAGEAGGDGTRGAPFGTIGEAALAATAGDVVAVAVGDYDEPVVIPAGVTIWGACPEGTVVRASEPSFTEGVLIAGGADTAVRNLSVGRSDRMGLFVRGSGTSMRADDVVILETQVAGASVEDHATFDAERIVVRRPRLWTIDRLGYGLNADTGGVANIRWAFVDSAVEFGVTANLDGASMTIEDAVVVDMVSLPDRTKGHALVANASGILTARRTVVLRANEVGAISIGEDAAMTLESCVVRDTLQAGLRTDMGRGIVAQMSSSLTLSKVLVERALSIGVFVADGVDARLEDVVVRDIERISGDQFGRGVSVQTSAFDADRLWIQNVFEGGLQVGLAGTEAQVSDLTVRGVKSGDDGYFGRGVISQMGASVTLERAEISDVIEVGVAAMEDASLVASDLLVHDVVSRPQDGSAGYGVSAFRRSSISLTNSIVQDVQQVGILAFRFDSSLTLDGVEIRRVTPPDCSGATCDIFGASGHALGVYSASRVVATNFTVSDLDLCGVHIAEEGIADLSNGEVTGAEIGVCIQNEAQPVEDLQRDVVYRDNVTNLQATMLPVPSDPAGPAP